MSRFTCYWSCSGVVTRCDEYILDLQTWVCELMGSSHPEFTEVLSPKPSKSFPESCHANGLGGFYPRTHRRELHLATWLQPDVDIYKLWARGMLSIKALEEVDFGLLPAGLPWHSSWEPRMSVDAEFNTEALLPRAEPIFQAKACCFSHNWVLESWGIWKKWLLSLIFMDFHWFLWIFISFGAGGWELILLPFLAGKLRDR